MIVELRNTFFPLQENTLENFRKKKFKFKKTHTFFLTLNICPNCTPPTF